MQAVHARGLYDFAGDHDNGELTFSAGETLTIVAQVSEIETQEMEITQDWITVLYCMIIIK